MSEVAEITGLQILDLEMTPEENDARASTVREYFALLVEQVWVQGEGFRGKRAFICTGWDWDLFVPLIRAGLITGTIDEYRRPAEFDFAEGDRLVKLAIKALGVKQQ
jgi:hypothetical protein